HYHKIVVATVDSFVLNGIAHSRRERGTVSRQKRERNGEGERGEEFERSLTRAVVNHFNAIEAIVFEPHFNTFGACIDTVLHQLFHLAASDSTNAAETAESIDAEE